jgi:hypothetical protein
MARQLCVKENRRANGKRADKRYNIERGISGGLYSDEEKRPHF